jgi:putative peptide zinc metalloprotease protein
VDVDALARPLFSSSWYRVASLQPRIRPHARIVRHEYRGQPWHVLEDRLSERFYRFSPSAYLLVGLMDGTRTVQQIWDAVCDRLGDGAPTQDEAIHLLAQLHAADVLQCDVTPDAVELFERSRTQRRQRLTRRLLSLFAWRVPLLDPDAFLRRTLPLARPFIGWGAGLVWVLVVGLASVMLAVHWRDFTANVVDHVFSLPSLIALWTLFPVIKALHELGHAFVTKAYGGEVHDMGVMMLTVTPVPYVDASAAWGFADKWRRITVGAAGMLVELFIAALAVLVWVNAEAGLVRTVAFAMIVNVGISTVLFNANPLLRFDGYYMLADWLEIPNLWRRAWLYLGYLCERYAFGRREAEPPATTPGEKGWFVVYGVASLAYRVVVVTALVMFLGRHAFYFAVVFAAVIAVGWIVLPAGKAVAYLATSPRLRKVRGRAVAATTAAVAAVVCVVGVVPVPYRSRAEGVVWIPEESFVRARTEGFVVQVMGSPGERVRRGDPLVVLRDPALLARTAGLEARRRELLARYDEQRPSDRVKTQVIEEELRFVEQGLGEARRRVRDLTISAGADGTLVMPVPSQLAARAPCPCSQELPGRFVKDGELVGYVVELATVTVRAVVHQEQIDLIRDDTRAVWVRLAERLWDPRPARIRRVVPAASERLPDRALGTEGGGKVLVDPRATGGVTATEKLFQVDLELSSGSGLLNVGGRAYVRFDHDRRPLAQQWYREIRQLFLGRFSV